MDNLFKEDLSFAYLQAVCAKSEITCNRNQKDHDGADATLKKGIVNSKGDTIKTTVEVQLKSTNSPNYYREDDDYIYYKASQKCYNDLVDLRGTPLYLFLLILPEQDDECVVFNIDSLVLKRCMYWTKLEAGDNKTTQSSVTIKINKMNALSPEELNRIMETEANNI